MLNEDIISVLSDHIQTLTHSNKKLILVGPIQLPVNLDGETIPFQWYSWLPADHFPEGASTEDIIQRLPSLQLAESQQSSVLVYGDFANAHEALIRMHSICHTGDIFGSKRCDCGFQLRQSMRMIQAHGAGALFYLANHEGRGIGLFSKAMAYILQENGYDTVDANLELGFADDTRSYTEAIAVLQALRTKPVSLITNNPKKLRALKSAGMNVKKRIPLWGDVSSYNEKYLQTKKSRSGHLEKNEAFI